MLTKLAISYDENLPVLSVSPGVWPKVMLSAWFKDHRIVCAMDNPLPNAIKTIDLRNYYADGEPQSQKISAVYQSEALKRLVAANRLENYFHLVSSKEADPSAPYKFVGNLGSVASRFENKVDVRKIFGTGVPFPPYRIMSLEDIQTHQAYERLQDELGGRLVLQCAESNGGHGTFLPTDADDFMTCLQHLQQLQASGEIVVSKRIEDARERSLQVCITTNKVYVGAVQAQLVRQPLLTPRRSSGLQFCGGRITPGLMNETTYAHAQKVAMHIGAEMQQQGYRGIFGIDMLVDTKEQLYVLEVNARVTGVTPLLSSVQQTLPYQLLHALEVTESDYGVDSSVAEQYGEGSFVNVYAQTDGRLDMGTGIYNAQGKRLRDGFELGSLVPENDDEYFVATRVSPGQQTTEGKVVASIYARQQLFDDFGELDPGLVNLVGILRQGRTQPE